MNESHFMPKNMPGRRVITYGTFDVLHHGHIRLLKRAKRFGSYLIVGLSTDAFNRGKGKESVFSYSHRRTILAAMRPVDKVIAERTWGQKMEDIKKYNVDVFVIGADWKGKFDHLKSVCEVIYLPRTAGISTTKIKRKMARIKRL